MISLFKNLWKFLFASYGGQQIDENKKGGTEMKVCLDAGHGGKDSGATYKGVLEKDVVLDVCKRTVEGLDLVGIRTVLTRSEDFFVELGDRSTIANKEKADIFISIHCNADADQDQPGMPEAKGEEIFHYPGSIAGKRLAEILAGWVDLIFPLEPFRGIKEANFSVLRRTSMPAVLVEIGFIDNSSTNEQLIRLDTRQRIAGLISEGIQEYFKNV